METKKKLRKDIEALRADVLELQSIFDTVDAKEAAKMLRLKRDYIYADDLNKMGIEYTKKENGALRINKKSLLSYIDKQNKKLTL